MNGIDASTRLVALLGSPVSHSLSPRLHNAAFAAAGLNIRYLAFNVPADALQPAVAGMRSLGFIGATLVVVPPLGQYFPDKLINLGSNRWSFKTELGLSYPKGPWRWELSAGAWFFTDKLSVGKETAVRLEFAVTAAEA